MLMSSHIICFTSKRLLVASSVDYHVDDVITQHIHYVRQE